MTTEEERLSMIRYRVVGELQYLDEDENEDAIEEWKSTHIDESVLIFPNEKEDDEEQALRLAIDMVAMFIDADLSVYEFDGRYINLTAQAAREAEQRKLAEWNAWATTAP